MQTTKSPAFSIQPYEILGYAWVLLAYLILTNLPVHYPIWNVIWQSGGHFWRYLLLALVVYAVASIYRRKRGLNRNEQGASYWIEIARITVVALLSMAFHFMLKSNIHLLNPRNYDQLLFEIDRALHLGIAPCFFFVELFKSPIFYRAIDFYYSLIYFFINLAYLPAIVVFATTFAKRVFATAYVLICILGLGLYVAIPSWGPVFTYPEQFQESLRQMPLTVTVQAQLHKETLSLIRNPQGKRTIRYGGIAAFPSLHVGLLMIFALASRTISKRWFHVNLLLTFLMLIGTMVTGYHYLIDGYAGIALGYGCWKLAEKLNHRDSETQRQDKE